MNSIKEIAMNGHITSRSEVEGIDSFASTKMTYLALSLPQTLTLTQSNSTFCCFVCVFFLFCYCHVVHNAKNGYYAIVTAVYASMTLSVETLKLYKQLAHLFPNEGLGNR